MREPVEIYRDRDDEIAVIQYCKNDIDIITLTQDQALKLAHRLMALAHGQGETDREIIPPNPFGEPSS